MDNKTKEQRHINMSNIHNKDTAPEVLVRKYLFRKGLRFRKNDKRLPGHPDIVLPKYHTVIFVNGCFWHGHDCKYAKLPATNQSFWNNKIEKNRKRDRKNIEDLEKHNWKVLIVWQCKIRNKEGQKEELEKLYKLITC